MHIEEKFFSYQGTKLYYFTAGKGKPLLFLPGGLHVSTYIQNIHFLSRYYKIIAVDLPGFGQSSTPNEIWELTHYADFLCKFLDYLKLPKINAVGHSYGGGVGLYLAMSQRLTKLVVYSPVGVTSDHNPVVFYFNVLVTKTVNDFFAMPSNRMRSIVFNNAISTVTKNFSNTKMMLQIINKVLYKSITPEALQQIQIPVKLVWGEKDELFPIHNGYYLQEHIPNSTLEILNGNHDWWTIHPKEGGEKVKAFIG